MKLHRNKLIFIPSMFVALSAQAHDPSEHAAVAEKPDCAAMGEMDHAKMDMTDPVAQAMMKKCMGEMEKMGDMGDMHKMGDMPEKATEQSAPDEKDDHGDRH